MHARQKSYPTSKIWYLKHFTILEFKVSVNIWVILHLVHMF